MAGNSSGNRRNLVGWIRLDGNGNIIPGSEQYRPKGVQPKNGYWRQIQTDYTDCNGVPASTLTILNNNSSYDVTTVETTDDGLEYYGTIAKNGGMYTFVIPFGNDYTFVLTAGGNVTAAVVTKVANNAPDGTTFSATVTGSGTSSPIVATPARSGQQYLLTLS